MRIESVDGKRLVSYRHMYIREIDLQQGRTRPLVVERREGSAATGSCEPPVALQLLPAPKTPRAKPEV